jgi:hypothetical protein
MRQTDITLLLGRQPRPRRILHRESFEAWKKRGKRRTERKCISRYLAASRAQANGQAVESWEAGDGWTPTSQFLPDPDLWLDTDDFQDVCEDREVEEGDYWYWAGDEDIEEEDLNDLSDLDVQDDPCGGYMPRIDDSDEDDEGGGTFGTSRDVVMVT